MEHKFQLGDMVEKEFIGNVEGIEVSVRKKLFIQWILLNRWDEIHYGLVERIPTKLSNDVGKQYKNIPECELIPVEPLINEAEKAKRKHDNESC